jgi:hypothetical protein
MHAEPQSLGCIVVRVVLFSGHMVDRPDRETPRFPATRVPAARRALARLLDRLGAQPPDRAVTGGAGGGDLLFAELALARGMALEVYLPFERERFIATSVMPGGTVWLKRFESVIADPRVALHVVPASDDADAYERCNLAMLDRAAALGKGVFDFVCMWDGESADGPGGTAHMVSAVRERGGVVHWIDTRTLDDSGEQFLADQD